MRTSVVVLSGLMAAALTPAAQGQFRAPRPEMGPRVLFYESLAVPSPGDSLHERVDIHYRIDREFFVPVRDPEGHSPFHRSGEIIAELADSTGGIAARSMHALELTEQDADRKPLGQRWEQGIFSLTVPRGKYRVLITAEDEESRRSIMDSSTFVRTSARNGLATASVVQIAPPAQAQGMPGSVELVNYGDEILFGRPASLLVIWNGLPGEDSLLSVRYSFVEEPPSPVDLPNLPPDGDVTVPVYRGVKFSQLSDSSHAGYTLSHDGARRACAAIVPVPIARLLLRTFRMSFTLRAGKDSSTIVTTTRAVWPDMPFTLKDIDNAIDALKYITSEAGLDSLKRGNLETRRSSLEGFWRSRGGSTSSAFNDVMTEYYRRADHATRNFGTLRQPDGFRSDRGRIYVLHGPPSSTDRTLDPVSGYQEVWTYTGIKKKFIFIDQNRSGTYVLVSTTTL